MENSVWDDKKILFFPLSFQIWQFHSEGAGTLQIQDSFVGMKDVSKLVGVQYSWRNKLQFGRAVWQANNLNGFRPLGIQSMANQWASECGKKCDDCWDMFSRHEDGYHIYTTAKGKWQAIFRWDYRKKLNLTKNQKWRTLLNNELVSHGKSRLLIT